AAKETEFYGAWIQYTYRQLADIRVVSINGVPMQDRLTLVSEVVFRDDGTREVRPLQRRGGLRALNWTREDTEVINNLQPFSITASSMLRKRLRTSSTSDSVRKPPSISANRPRNDD